MFVEMVANNELGIETSASQVLDFAPLDMDVEEKAEEDAGWKGQPSFDWNWASRNTKGLLGLYGDSFMALEFAADIKAMVEAGNEIKSKK